MNGELTNRAPEEWELERWASEDLVGGEVRLCETICEHEIEDRPFEALDRVIGKILALRAKGLEA